MLTWRWVGVGDVKFLLDYSGSDFRWFGLGGDGGLGSESAAVNKLGRGEDVRLRVLLDRLLGVYVERRVPEEEEDRRLPALDVGVTALGGCRGGVNPLKLPDDVRNKRIFIKCITSYILDRISFQYNIMLFSVFFLIPAGSRFFISVILWISDTQSYMCSYFAMSLITKSFAVSSWRWKILTRNPDGSKNCRTGPKRREAPLDAGIIYTIRATVVAFTYGPTDK